jgi:hypothetical protein
MSPFASGPDIANEAAPATAKPAPDAKRDEAMRGSMS